MPLTIFAKRSILDVWHGFEKASVYNSQFQIFLYIHIEIKKP